MACAPSEDSDQLGHLPSRIRVFAVRMKKAWVLSYPLSAQRRLWSDWADAQADLSLRWAHSHFVGFVMRRLILFMWFLFSSLHQKSTVLESLSKLSSRLWSRPTFPAISTSYTRIFPAQPVQLDPWSTMGTTLDTRNAGARLQMLAETVLCIIADSNLC